MEPWDRLIRATETRMPEVVELLRRLRDVGCELERQPSGRWRIRYGNAVASGRVTEAEMRDQWLKPNTAMLRTALALLEEPEEPALAEQPTTAQAGNQAPAEPVTLDPRPDLADDHDTWEVILAEARARDHRIRTLVVGERTNYVYLFALLRGLRARGVQVAQTSSGGLRLVWADAVHDDDPAAWRARYLDPYKDALAEHLKHVMEVMQRGQPAEPGIDESGQHRARAA